MYLKYELSDKDMDQHFQRNDEIVLSLGKILMLLLVLILKNQKKFYIYCF